MDKCRKMNIHHNTSGNNIQSPWDKYKRSKQKFPTVNHPNIKRGLHCSLDFIIDSLQLITSIRNNGMLKCILAITDTIKNVSHTQNSYSLCNQEELRGVSVSQCLRKVWKSSSWTGGLQDMESSLFSWPQSWVTHPQHFLRGRSWKRTQVRSLL